MPHPVEAAAVQLMFAWYATGEYSDDDIAKRLNREIFVLPDGTEVRFRTKGLPGAYAPQAFDKDAIQAFLTNAVYAGYVTYAGSDEHGNRRRKPVEWFEGKHEALVSLELFRKVQTIRQNRYHRSTTLANPARVYPLTGVLYCAAQHSPEPKAPFRAARHLLERRRQPLLRGSSVPAAVGQGRVASAQPARRLDRAADPGPGHQHAAAGCLARAHPGLPVP